MNYKLEHNISYIQDRISKYINDRKYELLTSISNITKYDQKFSYKCICNSINERSLKDIMQNKNEYTDLNYIFTCCRKSESTVFDKNNWFLNRTNTEYKDENNLVWIYFQNMFWVCENGNIISKVGNPIEYINNTIKLSRKTYTKEQLLYKVFFKKNLNIDEIAYFEDDISSISKLKIKKNKEVCLENNKELNYEDLIKENLNKIDNLEGFETYVIFENGYIFRKPYSKSKKYNYIKPEIDRTGNIVTRLNDKRIRTCKFILYAFNKDKNLLSLKDYDNMIISHKDGNVYNNSLSNLDYYSTKEEIQNKSNNIAVDEKKSRVDILHEEIKYLIKLREGTIITDLKTIKTTKDEFTYICKCNTKETKNLNDLKALSSHMCNICKTNLKITKDNDQTKNFYKEDEYFKKFDYGWVSNKGNFLNNLKDELYIDKEYMITINNTLFNAKEIIAKTFEIPFYELLNPVEGIYLQLIESNKGLAIENIYIWDRTKTNKILYEKNINYEIKRKELKDETIKYFSLSKEVLKTLGKPKIFQGVTFYKTGILSRNNIEFTKGRKRTDGYYDINVKEKILKVHRIICFLFNPKENMNQFNDYKGLEVNHIDGNKENNNYNNLEWLTSKENSNHALKTGLCKYSMPVLQFELIDNNKGNLLNSFESISAAHRETGLSTDHIKNVCKGITKPYKYYFEFKNIETKPKTQIIFDEE